MNRVEVGRYEQPENVGYKGWVCTDAWIVWEALDGTLAIARRGDDGSVEGHIAYL